MWRPGRLGHHTSTAVYGAQPEIKTKLNVDEVKPQCLLASTGHQRGMTALHHVSTCKREWRFEPVQLTEERSDVVLP